MATEKKEVDNVIIQSVIKKSKTYFFREKADFTKRGCQNLVAMVTSSDMVMTYMESKIILKKVDVKCHIIKVILFCVKVLIAEKKEKVTFD